VYLLNYVLYNSVVCVIKINISKMCPFQLCVLSKSLSISKSWSSFSYLRT